MKKRPSSILLSMVLGGLLVTGVAKVLIQFTASPVPDPGSGRTEPSLFAPVISTDWAYITLGQTRLLMVLSGAVLVCLFAWLFVAWMERRSDTAEAQSDLPSARQLSARRIFGRHSR